MLVHVTIKDSQSTENIKWFFFFFNLWQILHKYLYTAKVPFSLRSSMHKDEWNICLPVKVFPCCYDFPACTFLLCLKNKYLFLSSLSPNVTTLLYKKKKKYRKEVYCQKEMNLLLHLCWVTSALCTDGWQKARCIHLCLCMHLKIKIKHLCISKCMCLHLAACALAKVWFWN